MTTLTASLLASVSSEIKVTGAASADGAAPHRGGAFLFEQTQEQTIMWEFAGLRAKKFSGAWRVVAVKRPRQPIDEPAKFRGPFMSDGEIMQMLMLCSQRELDDALRWPPSASA
jgi:hypothetical protein